MDVYCRICREPIDTDEFHDIAAERYANRPLPNTVGAMFAQPHTYADVADDFRQRGCVALYGTPCTPSGDTEAIGVIYDLLGDDMDGAAAMFDDLL